MSGRIKIHHTDQDAIRALLLGRTVTKVDDTTLTLDDGRTLAIKGNEGGCICGAGDYVITELNDCPVNAIMAVEFESGWGDATDVLDHFRLFVLAADARIKLIEAEGWDSGYYGTGYWIEVSA